MAVNKVNYVSIATLKALLQELEERFDAETPEPQVRSWAFRGVTVVPRRVAHSWTWKQTASEHNELCWDGHTLSVDDYGPVIKVVIDFSRPEEYQVRLVLPDSPGSPGRKSLCLSIGDWALFAMSLSADVRVKLMSITEVQYA